MKIFSVLLGAICIPSVVHSCSNLLITPGASEDGSSMISYNADSASLYGQLYHYPAAKHEPGDMRQIYDWDTGTYLGEIPEAKETYNVIGNINEFGLSIGETTFGGMEELCSQPDAIIDYGSLIWITLQRAKTAREAIAVAADLMANYGYFSEGESFSIADPEEVWMMEIIGKGTAELGAVWVAQKIPDGYVSGHANQARTTTFPLDSPEVCLYANDTISFAKANGYYPAEAEDKDFSFSDAYDPLTFEGARFCEARVWSFFGNVTSPEWAAQYEQMAMGYDLANRMPLWVKPTEKLSLARVEAAMRNHFEGTSLAFTADVGAGSGALPYRARPLTWSAPSYPGMSYLNERAIGTQQTGWNFVASLRSWMPRELRGVLWFGVDDSATTVRFPVYACTTEPPAGWGGKGPQDGVAPPMMTFDMRQAHHVFNLVANWAYARWSAVYPVVLEEILTLQSAYEQALSETDAHAVSLYNQSASDVVAYVTEVTQASGESLISHWASFFGQLFVRFRDGYDITANPDDPECGCEVAELPYTGEWYDRIVDETGDHYADIPDETIATVVRRPKRKRDLRAFH